MDCVDEAHETDADSYSLSFKGVVPDGSLALLFLVGMDGEAGANEEQHFEAQVEALLEQVAAWILCPE